MLHILLKKYQYKAFVQYAIDTCDSFSLVFAKDDKDKTKYIQNDIYICVSDFVLSKSNIGVHPNTGSFFEHSDIVFFECNEYTGGILLKADDFFDWNGVLFPEELCFYRNNTNWFKVINHEKIAMIDNLTDSDMVFLNKNGINYF